MSETYAHPEVLVSTEWVDRHRHDTESIRIVESDEDVLLYDTGHIPGAVKIDWHNDLQDQVVRDYIDEDSFADLCSAKGIGNDTTVVFYGDKSNWWACYAFWVFKLYGHERCLIMDGGRAKWKAESRDMTTERPDYDPRPYKARAADHSIRAFRDEVLAHVQGGRWWTSGRPTSSRGSCCTCPTIRRRGRCVAGTSRAPRTCRGPGR